MKGEMKMAKGDTVQEMSKAEALQLALNTGETSENGTPIVRRVTINGINPDAQEQAKYDLAYSLASLTSQSVEGVRIRRVTELGPIT